MENDLELGLGLEIEVGPGRPPRLVVGNPRTVRTVNWAAHLKHIQRRGVYLSEVEQRELSRARAALTSRYELLLTPGTERNTLMLEQARYSDLLKEKNAKIDATFGAIKTGIFSLPEVYACPGAGRCVDICFAGIKLFNTDASALLKVRNWTAATQPDFVSRVTREVKKGKLRFVRIHDAGDFFADWYAHRWMDIAEACPGTIFYAYTKSAKIMKQVLEERGGRWPVNFSVIYSWGMKETQLPYVELEKGDRMALIICAPSPAVPKGKDFPLGPVEDETMRMCALLVATNERHKLRSVGADSPLFEDGTHSDLPAATGTSQFVLLGWHGGSRGELDGIGHEPGLTVPMTGQGWNGYAWSRPAKYSRRLK